MPAAGTGRARGGTGRGDGHTLGRPPDPREGPRHPAGARPSPPHLSPPPRRAPSPLLRTDLGHKGAAAAARRSLAASSPALPAESRPRQHRDGVAQASDASACCSRGGLCRRRPLCAGRGGARWEPTAPAERCFLLPGAEGRRVPEPGGCRSLAAAAASQLPPGGLRPRLGRGRRRRSPRPPHPRLMRRAPRTASGSEESSARLLRRLLGAGAPARPAAAPGSGSCSPCCPAGPGRAAARAPPAASRGRTGAAPAGGGGGERSGTPGGGGRAGPRRKGGDVTPPGLPLAILRPRPRSPGAPSVAHTGRLGRPPSCRRPRAPRGSQRCPPSTLCPGLGAEPLGGRRGEGSASRCREQPAGSRHPGARLEAGLSAAGGRAVGHLPGCRTGGNELIPFWGKSSHFWSEML